MKQFSNQKWILSAVLIAALGSQYYFSTSSKTSGFIEMSQLAETQETIVEIAAALRTARPAGEVVAADTAAKSAALSGDRTSRQKTEAVVPVIPCAECAVLTKAQTQALSKLLNDLIQEKKEVAKAKVEVPETPLEKMRREREERSEKLKEVDLAKKEKQKDEQNLRDEKFINDFERLSSRCSNVECHSSSLATALNRYTDKSRMISPKVVNEIFNEYIAKDLKEGLKDPDNSSARDALETLMADIPTSYRNLKTKAIDLAKAVAVPMAIEANNSFKQAEQLRKANKINESNSAFNRGNEQKAELVTMLKSQYEAIHDGTDRAQDKMTYTYYNNNYAKPANKWLSDIMNSNNFSIDESGAATVSNNPLISGTTRGVVRGGESITTTGPQINNTFGSPTNGSNNLNFPNSGPQFGNTQTGFRGGRN